MVPRGVVGVLCVALFFDVGEPVAMALPLRRRIRSSLEVALTSSVSRFTTISPDSRDTWLSEIVL